MMMMGSGPSGSWMVERAREELETLEALHPNSFHSLKLELKSLIFDHSTVSVAGTATVAATQASSNNRHKRKKTEEVGGEKAEHSQGSLSETNQKQKDRVEMAIERAEACLKRIRLVKRSFFL